MSTVNTSGERSGFLPVSVDSLRPPVELGFDVYIKREANAPARLYRSRQIEIRAADVEKLKQRGVSTLYVTTDSAAEFHAHLREHVLVDESIPVAKRYTILKEAMRSTLVESLRQGDVKRITAVTDDLSEQLVNLVCDRNVLLFELFGVMVHDFSTYTHVVNVCTYAILLAQALGVRDRKELMDVGQGALLHDLGKQFVPATIMQKPGRLTAKEQGLVREHPARGFKLLCGREDLSWGALMMVYEHHERCDGGGYPVGLIGREMHPWGRLCAVADVFDALTRDRPYRKASRQRDVLAYLDQQAGRGFDEEMVQCWISTLKDAR